MRMVDALLAYFDLQPVWFIGGQHSLSDTDIHPNIGKDLLFTCTRDEKLTYPKLQTSGLTRLMEYDFGV
jgi:hypothetical protein